MNEERPQMSAGVPIVKIRMIFQEFLAIIAKACYDNKGATSNGRRFPLVSGVKLLAPNRHERGWSI